ncbi:T0016682 isoform 2, partial [Pan troglodytes]
SMPGYKCSIKERMLYSSCKSRLLDSVEQDFHLEIAKKPLLPLWEGTSSVKHPSL